MNNDVIVFKGIANGIRNVILGLSPLGQFFDGYLGYIKERQAERKAERFKRLYLDIDENLKQLNYKVNEEYVKQDDFLDIVEEVTTKVINERNEEKRRYYKNIFLHSITAKKVDYDVTEKYLNLLSRLENEDIIVFAALHHPDLINKEKDCPLRNPNEQVDGYQNISIIHQRKSVAWALTMLLGWNDEQVRDTLNVLQRERLIEEGTDKLEQSISGSPVIVLRNHLSIKGRSFAKYLMM